MPLRQDRHPETYPPRDDEVTYRVWRIYTLARARGLVLPIRAVARRARCSLAMARRARYVLLACGHLTAIPRAHGATAVRVAVSRPGPYQITRTPRAHLSEETQILLAKLGR